MSLLVPSIRFKEPDLETFERPLPGVREGT